MKKIGIILLALLLMTGCTRIDEQIAGRPRVVTGIDASYDSGAIRLNRQYSDSEKLRAVLMYFRCLEVYGTVAPEVSIPQISSIRVTLTYSDGTAKTYDQRDGQYLRQDDGPWHYINQEQAQDLPILLGFLESD